MEADQRVAYVPYSRSNTTTHENLKYILEMARLKTRKAKYLPRPSRAAILCRTISIFESLIAKYADHMEFMLETTLAFTNYYRANCSNLYGVKNIITATTGREFSPGKSSSQRTLYLLSEDKRFCLMRGKCQRLMFTKKQGSKTAIYWSKEITDYLKEHCNTYSDPIKHLIASMLEDCEVECVNDITVYIGLYIKFVSTASNINSKRSPMKPLNSNDDRDYATSVKIITLGIPEDGTMQFFAMRDEDAVWGVIEKDIPADLSCCDHCYERKTPEMLLICAGCTKVKYCSKECQVAAWGYHKKSCQKK